MPPVSIEDKSSSSVGIIYPPPEVRNIVDKTASFVARNGPEFEQRIKQNEVNNPKFNFLSSGDPYHAYYQHRVVEIREGKEETKKAPAPKPTAGTTEAMKQRQSEILKQAQKDLEPPPPKDPPADFEFIADPPSISAFDLDVVKLTAQFVARNGRQFLTTLMHKEQRNYQFDFLRPQHSLFQYFTKLLEQYTKVLIPPKNLVSRLKEELSSDAHIKAEIDYRVRWIKHQEAKKRREEEQLERERVSYAQVDWHNFVVVETVDYQQWEVGNFPPPTNPAEVGARVLMQRRVESMPASAQRKMADDNAGGSNTNVEDMEEDSSDSSEEEDDDKAPTPMGKPVMAVDAAPAVQKPPALPTPGNVEVRKYDPKQAKTQKKQDHGVPEEYLVSPITGERVPASKVQEHMRIGLLDPRWVEERDKQITARATEDTVFAPAQSIESSLKQLAERRTDIFGVGEEAAQETAIGKKMGEEERRGMDVPWDGSSSSESTSKATRGTISINEQIEQIHRSKGLLPEKSNIGPKPTISEPPRPPMPMPPVAMPPAPMIRPPPQVMVQPPQPPPQFFVPSGFPPMPAPAPPREMIPPPMMQQQHHEMEEPANKRPRGEDHLIPESEFLARNPPEVTFRVACPNLADKSEWKLNGQMLSMTLPLMDPVSAIKSKLHEETSMPPGKQKLQLESIFLKDANSLAYYNMRPGTVVMLQVKERGGRKK